MSRTVLFLCRHNAAKSVIAAAIARWVCAATTNLSSIPPSRSTSVSSGVTGVSPSKRLRGLPWTMRTGGASG